MKILMVTDKMDIGGAETHIFTLIVELSKRGEHVTVVSGGGAYAEQLKRAGVRVLHAPLDKRDPLSVVRCARILKAQMRECDIVHTHTRFTSYLAYRIRGSNSFPKIVVTAHLNFKLFPFGALARWGDVTLAVSEDIKSYLLKNYRLDANNVHVTVNSVDASLYGCERSPKKLIVHTSRIDRGRAKTAFMLCEVAEKLLPRHSDWRILIVGDGNCFSSLKKRAAAANKNLGFEGVILSGARYDIPSILRYGSIFVGVSRSALEGMASGLPTIICGDEGYGGLLTEDNFSLLLSSNFCARGLTSANPHRLAADISLLINNRDIARSSSEYGRKVIEALFTAGRMANDAVECYSLTRPAPTICLCGYFGYSNLGDEMILRSAISALESCGITHVSVLVKDPDRAAFRKMAAGRVNLTAYNRFEINDVIKAIDCSDALVLCGGNLLQNETSFASLAYYTQIVRYAAGRGKRIYILSGGFGELRGLYPTYLAAKCLSRADFCGCRTQYDLEFAKKYAKRTALMPDMCFLLGGQNRRSESGNSFAWIVSKRSAVPISDVLNISLERKLTPIAVILNPNDTSRRIEIEKHGIAIYAPNSFEEFAAAVKNCEFSISERLHGAIFSLLCHIPSYITADTVKNRALLSEIDKLKIKNVPLISYRPECVTAKKEIGVQDSDFNYLIDLMRRRIYCALNEIFD